MPRVYKPSDNKRYKKYDDLIIGQALEEYAASSSKSYAKIAEKYNIPKSVLHRHNTRFMKKQGGQTALSADVEEYLILYLNACSEWGYPLEIFDLRLLIKGYLDRCGQQIKRFKDNMPGPDFVQCFLKRHKEKITKRLSQNIKRCRAAVSPPIVDKYFDELEISLNDVPSSNIINYDETNLTDDPGRKKVLVKRSVKYPERVMNHTKSSTSLMMACSADGSLLPPYVVYKAKHIYDSWTLNGPKGCRYNRTPSGWFDSITFEDWVRTIILPYFKNKIGPKVLIGDNLSSHFSIELIKECKEQGVAFIFLPANSTHLTQPLDVSFFRPMKNAWREILFRWKKTEGRLQATIPKTTFPSLLKKLMEKLETNSSKNILAGFEKCGICPINRSKVLDRLPTNLTRGEENYKEAIDSSVMALLEEMRYGTETNRPCRKKKMDVVAGRSVGAGDDSESDESNTESIPDDANSASKTPQNELQHTNQTNSNTTSGSPINTTKGVLHYNADNMNIQSPGPSGIRKRKTPGIIKARQSIEGITDLDENCTDSLEHWRYKMTPEKSKVNGKTNNKSLIKKTKVNLQDKIDQAAEHVKTNETFSVFTDFTKPAKATKQKNKINSKVKEGNCELIRNIKTEKCSKAKDKTNNKFPNKKTTSKTQYSTENSTNRINTNGARLQQDPITTSKRRRLTNSETEEKICDSEMTKYVATDFKKENCSRVENGMDLPKLGFSTPKRIDEFNVLEDDSIILNEVTELSDGKNDFIDSILSMGIENVPIIYGDMMDVTQEIEVDFSARLTNTEKENDIIHEQELKSNEQKIIRGIDKKRDLSDKKPAIICNEPGDCIKEKVIINKLRKVTTKHTIKKQTTKKYYRNDVEILKDLMNDNV